MSPPAWIEIARRKQEEQGSRIPKEWVIDGEKWMEQSGVTVEEVLKEREGPAILSERELDITSNNDAVDLVEKIRAGELSSEEVVTAFCKRAAVVHQLVSGKCALSMSRNTLDYPFRIIG
jgi:amidase